MASVIEVWRGPRFLEKPKNTVAVEKGDIELVCQVEAEPQATVQWWENDLYIFFQAWISRQKGSSKELNRFAYSAIILQKINPKFESNQSEGMIWILDLDDC